MNSGIESLLRTLKESADIKDEKPQYFYNKLFCLALYTIIMILVN